MGKTGVGKKINGKRGKFILEQVKNQNTIIYNSIDKKLNMTEVGSLIFQNSSKFLGNSDVKIILKTPLRLKFENKLQAFLPFHILVRAMLRRMSSLLNAFGEGEPAIDYKGLINIARNVEIAESNLAWFDWRRYSFRQDQAMLMGGITGSIIYRDVPFEFMPLFDFCEKVHIGKQTTFGLGQFEVEKIA